MSTHQLNRDQQAHAVLNSCPACRQDLFVQQDGKWPVVREMNLHICPEFTGLYI